MITKVRDFIDPYNYVSCPPDLLLIKAIEISKENNKVRPIIIKDNDLMVGIFTERDLALLVINRTQMSNLTIGDVMTQNPVFVDSDASIQICAQLMVEHEFKQIPVKNQTGRIYGVIDIYTVLNAMLDLKNLQEKTLAV